MKCAVAFSILLAGCCVALADAPTPKPPTTLLDEIVRMTRAGDSDRAVLAYAKAHRAELPPEVDDATLRWLRDSGVRPAVVSYMSAIDVRAQSTDAGAGGSEGVTYADTAGRPRPADGGEDADYDAGESAVYTGLGSNAGGAPYSEPYDYGYGYGYGPYSSFGYGYPYWGSPFPTWFVVDVSHDHSHGHHGHHGGWRDHDHNAGGGDRHGGGGWHNGAGGRHDGWRDRGSGGPRDSGMTAGHRTFSRPEIARSARSGRGGPALGGGRRNPGYMGPRGQPAGSRGFTRPASSFTGSAPGRSGGSFARAPITAPARGGGGARTAGPPAGSPAGRGRR